VPDDRARPSGCYGNEVVQPQHRWKVTCQPESGSDLYARSYHASAGVVWSGPSRPATPQAPADQMPPGLRAFRQVGRPGVGTSSPWSHEWLVRPTPVRTTKAPARKDEGLSRRCRSASQREGNLRLTGGLSQFPEVLQQPCPSGQQGPGCGGPVADGQRDRGTVGRA
jgi:hypothetical protein